jgi:hypothetical protein
MSNFNQILSVFDRALNFVGYNNELRKNNYEFFTTNLDQATKIVPKATFAQVPTNIRNSCIIVISDNGKSGTDNVIQYRDMAAPLVFEYVTKENLIRRWKSGVNRPEFIENIAVSEIENAFKINKAEWNPETIFRAKVISKERTPAQLDFIDIGLLPAVEGDIHERLHRLLNRTFEDVIQVEPQIENVFRLVFRFIAAKVLIDEGHKKDWGEKNANEILKVVENYYNSDGSQIASVQVKNQQTLDIAWNSIKSSFHFQNLSVDDLAFVYENTLISPETRKKYGVHSTPPHVAEYIVRNLAIENIPENERYVLEPCSGHGIFLISAMRRLRELLKTPMTSKERHSYFVERLTGIELDSFALEVCRLSLMLADYPNPDGWNLYQEDVFATDRLEKELKKARIVLCNPPFKVFDQDEKQKYGDKIEFTQPPREILRRILTNPPETLGFVMPAVFSTSDKYKDLHLQLANIYGNIELTELPDKIFNHAEIKTTLITASEKRNSGKRTFVSYRIVNSRDAEDLKNYSKYPQIKEFKNIPKKFENFTLWTPKSSKLWFYLSDFSQLKDVAKIKTGIRWLSKDERKQKFGEIVSISSETENPNFKKGCLRVEDTFEQYKIKQTQYLSLLGEHQKNNAFELAWDLPKVVCNASRLSRDYWRLGAFADDKGFCFSKQFFCIWSINKITSIYSISALLNSPLANAFVYENDNTTQSDNRISTLEKLPIPPLEYLIENSKLSLLAEKFQREMAYSDRFTDEKTLKQLLLEIDAEVLKAYDLPPFLERQLLDCFQGIKRPVPIEFTGYYPENFTAYLPLHELISEDISESKGEKLLKNIEPIYDTKISEMLTWLNE